MRSDQALMFGGQGAYAPGALMKLEGAAADDVREVLRVVDAVAAEFGRAGVSELLRNTGGPSAAELAQRDPFALQLAIFAIGVAGQRMMASSVGGFVYVGHSMGEIAALTAAGAFELADGARLVCHRAEALEAACRRRGGMLSVQLSAARAAHLVELVDDPEAAVAVRNAPGLTVLAGPEEALASFVRIADAMDVRSSRLPAPYAFHSPMLAVAAGRFAAKLEGIRQRPLRARVYSPVAQRFVHDGMDLKQLLVQQLTAQVDFLGALRALHEAGVQHFVEGIASGLSALVKRSVPGAGAMTSGMTSGMSSAGERAGAEMARGTMEIPVVAMPEEEILAPTATTTTAIATPAAAIASAPSMPHAPTLSEVLEQLRGLYADTLGYPPEAITPDADLEADLGIDSLKRAEMLAKVTVHFRLKDADDGRYASHQTLAELAGLVVASTEA